MFVDDVQKGHIDRGERPALRAVFRKAHGAAHGIVRMRPDIPDDLRVGLFALKEVPAWVRFSSDTEPGATDYTSTLGVALKLFGVPGLKLIGHPGDTTMDLLFQNHDVFFAATATDMCQFAQAGVIRGDYPSYLKAHPTTAAILAAMSKPVSSVLASPYWSVLPFRLGEKHTVKYKLVSTIGPSTPSSAPLDPNYLAAELFQRLSAADGRFELAVQPRTDPAHMPVDDATAGWDETVSPPIVVADLLLPRQDVGAAGQAEFVENLAFNIWRVPAEHAPLGSVAQARRAAYEASAAQRRQFNGVSLSEPASPNPTAGQHERKVGEK